MEKYDAVVNLLLFTSIVFVARKESAPPHSLCRAKAGYTLAVTDIVK